MLVCLDCAPQRVQLPGSLLSLCSLGLEGQRFLEGEISVGLEILNRERYFDVGDDADPSSSTTPR